MWPDIPPTWELEHDARGHSEKTQNIWSRCTCTFGRFACLRTGLLFAPSDLQQPVLDSASRSGHRRSLHTKELHLAWRCKLGTEAPRGEEDGKMNHQTSPSMHVKPDTPPTARHGESWNVMPAVWP